VTWQPDVGAVLESQQHALAAALRDGTRLDLEPQTTLAGVPTEAGNLELELRRGRASFDVTHNPQRQFRVRAGNVTVVVLGTRFSVERHAGTVTVAVERGKVAVESGAEIAYLTPGQRWEGLEGAPRAAESLSDETSPNAAPDVVSSGEADPASAPRADAEPASSEPGEPRANTGASKPNGSSVAAAESVNPAKELFDASREARRVGDSRRAAQLLQQLVAQYPSDPRAGLAAFELGRIRADVLGDLSGAITALEQALRLSPQGSFRQDALARLAHAYERAGRTQACKATRQRYLAAYGEGVHAQRVLKLCP
jgi:transmembrane sensor